MNDNKKTRFSPHFLWGASVAAHQVEGGNHNQWSVWELENAKSLAHSAEYHYGDLESWEHIKDEATRPETYISGTSTEHYERYEEDFDIAKELNMNALRFSVEWSRIEPTEGAWNVEAIEHYKKYIVAMRKRGLEPMMTLFHFTLPVWFTEMGGFEKKRNIKYFIRYCEKVMTELGAGVTYVTTINEPEVYVSESYSLGHWPPAHANTFLGLRVLHNLATAHKQAAASIHAQGRRYKVSISKNASYIYAGDDSKLSMWSAAVVQSLDDYFLRRVYKHCDYLGINYYFSDRFYGYRIHNPNVEVSDLGWDMSPENLEYVLERLYRKFHLPIIITENGLADKLDKKRQWWLSQTIRAMQNAIHEGVDLRGYLHWSLVDNFEWNKGTWPRFGLVEIDYATKKRTVRPSAKRYGAFIKKVRG